MAKKPPAVERVELFWPATGAIASPAVDQVEIWLKQGWKHSVHEKEPSNGDQ